MTDAKHSPLLPLLSTQYGLWLSERNMPRNPALVSGAVLDIRGEIDPATLARAARMGLSELDCLYVDIEVHEGVPMQRVRAHRDTQVEQFDFSAAERPDDAVDRWQHARLTRAIDLDGPLVRISLIKLGSNRWQLLLEGHHLVCDGYTAGLAGIRIAAFYRHFTGGPAPEPIGRLADLVADDQAYLSSTDLAGDSDYWAHFIANERPLTSYGSRSWTQPRGEFRVSDRLDSSQMDALRQRARELRVSWPVLALIAGARTVARQVGQREITLTVPASRRTTECSRNTAGMLANFLPMFIDLNPWDDLAQLIASTSRQFKDLLKHQRYPAGYLRRQMQLSPLDRRPFGPTVNILGYAGDLDLGGAHAMFRDISSGPVDDVQLTFQNRADGALDLYWNVNPELYMPDEAVESMDVVRDTLDELIGGTSRMPRPIRRQAVLHGPEPTASVADVLTALRRHAAGDPTRVAALDEQDSMTYAELDEAVRGTARSLWAAGARPGTTVAVCVAPTITQLIRVLAIWACGATYLPLDSSSPPSRNASMMGDAGAGLVCGGATPVPADLVALLADGVRVVSEAELGSPGPEFATPPRLAGQIAYVIFTSGSTGRPKGAMVDWAGMTNHLMSKVHELDLGPEDRTAASAPLTFDISIWQLMAPILSGGAVQIIDRTSAADPDLLLTRVDQTEVTVLELVPALLRPVLEGWLDQTLPRPRALRTVLCTGEELPADLCVLWRRLPTHPQLVNAYGPTECSDDVTHWAVPGEGDLLLTGRAPIGSALQGASLYVLDSALEPVPPGGAGELYVGGVVVGPGYVSLPTRTASTFVADRFSTEPGKRMYRTGDRVRWRADGLLEYLERVDRQVKLRGFRIELGEIEAAIQGIDEVAQTVVTVVGEGERRQLCAYLVGSIDAEQARARLVPRLPAHLIPTAWVELDSLPLTTNGKVDLRSLPMPSDPESGGSDGPARTLLTQLVAQEVAEVLGLSRVAAGDNFFDLGGNSLLATRLVARLRKRLGLSVGLEQLFEVTTVEELAALDPALTPQFSPPPIQHHSNEGEAVASLGQRRLWTVQQLDPADVSYHVGARVTLDASIDLTALSAALSDCLLRHTSLRTTLCWEGDRLLQRPVAVGGLDVDLPFRIEAVPAAEVADWEHSVVARPIDLARGPVRTRVASTSDGRRILLIVIHHSACDGWSLRQLVDDLDMAYGARLRGAEPRWGDLPLTYQDYAWWQHSSVVRESTWLLEQREFWRGYLSELPRRLTWPAFPASAAENQEQTARQDSNSLAARPAGEHLFEVPAEMNDRLASLCRSHLVTPFNALHTALAAVLARLTGQTEFLIGTAAHGRPVPELDHVVGFFANTVLVRSDAGGALSWRDLLVRHRDTLLLALSHADAAYEDVAAIARDLGASPAHPLVQVMLAYQRGSAAVEGMSLEVLESGHARFDLALECVEADDQESHPLSCRMEYALDAISTPTAELIAEELVLALRAMVEHPEQLADLLPDATRTQLFEQGRGPVRTVSYETALAAIEGALKLAPDSPAVIWQGRRVSHRELDERTSQWARVLINRGVTANDVVAVVMPRSLDWVYAVLGILKTGAAFLIMDVSHPEHRIAATCDDAGAAIVLTGVSSAHLVAESGCDHEVIVVDGAAFQAEAGSMASNALSPAERAHRPEAADLAYVVYTSGSTGRPKGVAVTQRALANLIEHEQQRLAGGPPPRLVQFAGPSFDAAVWEVVTAIGCGGALLIPTAAERTPGHPLSQYLNRHQANVVCLPPTVLAAMPLSEGLPSQLQLIVAGEHCPPELIARWADRVKIINAYGPSEATVCSTMSKVLSTAAPEGIGNPISNTQVFLLDRWLKLVAPGAIGELHVAGEPLARGYLGHGDVTACRFVANPYGPPGARMYRTGDLARWSIRGDLEFCGRADDQVKIRGMRVELNEVRSALLDMSFVMDAAVVVREDRPGDRRLVAYAVYQNDLPIDSHAVRDRLAERLPSHLVPHALVELAEIPTTLNGKVDPSRLPVPLAAGEAEVGRSTSPASPSERTLRSIFAEVLGVPDVDGKDDFLRLGGDSIMAVSVVSRARDQGLALTAQQVLQLRTPAELADAAQTMSARQTSDGHQGSAVLLPVGQWLAEAGGPVAGFAQSVVVAPPPGISAATMQQVARRVLERHPLLGARLDRSELWSLEVSTTVLPGDALSDATWPVDTDPAGAKTFADPHTWPSPPLDPEVGRMVRGVIFSDATGEARALGLQIHHLVVDGVSWRILLDDLRSALQQLSGTHGLDVGSNPIDTAEPLGTSYRRWSELLRQDSLRPTRRAELGLWTSRLVPAPAAVTGPALDPRLDVGGTARVRTSVVDSDVSAGVLRWTEGQGTSAEHLLLAAFASALVDLATARKTAADLLIRVEGHGRADLSGAADLSRTVGWFTSEWPVRLDLRSWSGLTAPAANPQRARAAHELLGLVQQQIQSVPDRGIGYGMLRYGANQEAASRLSGLVQPDLAFNYLGRVEISERDYLRLIAPVTGSWDNEAPLPHAVELNALLEVDRAQPNLRLQWNCAGRLVSDADIDQLTASFVHSIRVLTRISAGPTHQQAMNNAASLSVRQRAELLGLDI